MPSCKANTDNLIGYKVKIYPDSDQIILINNTIDIYRTIYNIGLSIQNDAYENGESFIKFFDMCKIFSEMRNNDSSYHWMRNVPIGTIREALKDLDNAFNKFFLKVCNHPKFKSKKRSKKVFSVRSDRCTIYKNYISVSGIGKILVKNHNIPNYHRLYNTSVMFDGYDYWFSCCIELIRYPMIPVTNTDIIGIDVGIRNMITTSDGEIFKWSNTQKYEKRLKRQQRRLQRYYDKYLKESIRTKTKYEDIPKSKNMKKLLYSQHKTYQKIKNKKNNDIHTATKMIVDKYPKAIVIESISVRDQQRTNKWILKYTPHMMYYKIHSQLQYKAKERGIPIIKADANYPSSQICSNCGNIYKPPRSIYKCTKCGFRIDRDINAAINLRNFGCQKVNSITEVV